MEKQVLPSDVMLEIFSRVPARSVGRFRCVSKLYHLLLSQPSFIKQQLQISSSNIKLIVHLKEFRPKRTRYIYYPIDNNNNNNLTEDYEIHDDDGVSLLGSCNGLFYSINKKGILALWNPTTKEVHRLPQLLENTKFDCFRESYESTHCFNHYGFGYDELNDDYKIVCVICVSNKGNRKAQTPSKTATYIYSHANRCWKEIESFPRYCIQFGYDNCQFLHGKIHWVAYTSRDEDGRKESQIIVSLDLATERYGTVPPPPTSHPGDDLNVCVLGGELCYYINGSYMYDRGFEVWMMKEYGVEQSWFQFLTIPLQNLLYTNNIYYHRECVPLYVMQSGEILLKAFEDDRESIYLYNPKTCNFITVNTVKDNAFLSGHIYVESLVETAPSFPALA